MNDKIGLQISFWVLITGIFFGVATGLMPLKSAILTTCINLSFYAFVFYTNTLYLFPKYYQDIHNRKYFLSVVILVLISASCLVKVDYLLVFRFQNTPPHMKHPQLMLILRSIFWMVLMVMLGTVYLIQKRYREHLLLHKQIQEDKFKTELQLLKSQINPHFLFNALNNIFSLSYMKSDKAPESILKLSGMLRYVIEDCNTEMVPLKSEIEYIENFLSFQRMKSPDFMNVIFEYEQLDLNLKVAPMLFIPFLENSFKYSQIGEYQNASIKIELKSTNKGELIFSVVNSIPPTGKVKPGAGTGINNVRQRLNIIYPNKHKLTLEESADKYMVTLNIDTNETSMHSN